jgi:hypothetical protein
MLSRDVSWNGSWNECPRSRLFCCHAESRQGHIEQLPSGSFRVSVYAGTDPLTRRAIRLKSTIRTEQQAHIELGRLLKEASEGHTPESDATVAKLLDRYLPIAGWDLSTRESNLGYIRRTIKPAIGSMQVRKVRGPLLDTFYARLMRCGNLACTGRPFTEHRNVPDLRSDPSDPRPEWQQAADKLRAAIETGELQFRRRHRPPAARGAARRLHRARARGQASARGGRVLGARRGRHARPFRR